MDRILTCVTLSAVPTLRSDLPEEVVYKNAVSLITSSAELHSKRLNSLKELTTPNWVWCDDDDPWKWPKLTLAQTKVLHGDELVNERGVNIQTTEVGRDWTAEDHLCRPKMMHKAICPAAATLRLLPLLPEGEFYTEHLVYYLLAAHCGTTYKSEIVTQWNCARFGMHQKVTQAIHNTVVWLMQNQARVLGELNATR